MVYTIAFFCCSVTSGSGDRPEKEGCHGGGVYSFFPQLKTMTVIPEKKIFGSEQKRPGANRPPEFVPESPLQKGRHSGGHLLGRPLLFTSEISFHLRNGLGKNVLGPVPLTVLCPL